MPRDPVRPRTSSVPSSSRSRGGTPRGTPPPTPGRTLPYRPPTPKAPAAPSKKVKLRRDESLLDISTRLDVPVDTIMAANPNLNVPATGVVINVPVVPKAGAKAPGQIVRGEVPPPGGAGLSILPTLNRLTAPVRNFVGGLVGQYTDPNRQPTPSLYTAPPSGGVPPQRQLGRFTPPPTPAPAPSINVGLFGRPDTPQAIPGVTLVDNLPVAQNQPPAPPSTPAGGGPVVNTLDQLWGGEPWSFYDPESVIAVADALAQKMQEGQFPFFVFPPTQKAWGVTDTEMLAAGYEKNDDGIWVRQDVGGLPETQGYSTDAGGGGYRTYKRGRGGGGGGVYPRAYNSTGYKYAPTGFGLVNWRI